MYNMTFKQVCDEAKINESTGRFYKSKFEAYFSYTGTGRHKKYSPQAAETLRLIADLYGKGLDSEQVEDKLEERYGVPAEDSSTYAAQQYLVNNSSNSYAVQQREFLDAIRQVFQEELTRRDEVITELHEELSSVKETILKLEQQSGESSRATIDRDRDIMQAIRSIQESAAQQQRNRSWIKRLFGGK